MSRLSRPFLWIALLATAILLCGYGEPASAQDGDFTASELVVRLNRLEGQIRTLSGQVEQQQFENRQLKDQLRKFQEDTEFRFGERSGGGARSGPAPPSATPSTTPSNAARPQRRSDAFDPEASPAAPGAPRTLGTAPETGPIVGGNPDTSRGAARPTSTASVGADPARAEYEAAYALYASKQYDGADAGFRRFVQAHPRDRSTADAIYYLGDSLLQRNKPRDAAEQFLKVSTDHGRSARAPDAMLKLGISLSALGAKDQACATLAELGRKYPTASASVKQGVDREQKRVRCPS